MFTLPVPLPPQPRTDRVLASGPCSVQGEEHPSRVPARKPAAAIGNALAAVATAKAAFLKNSVCYANERNHLQPRKHQTCFNYTLISSINTPHSGRAGRRRLGADNYQPTPDCTRRRRRGERLKNVTALTVASKPKGAAAPSWRPLLKPSEASDGRSGRSQTEPPADGGQTPLIKKMGQFGLLSPLKASKVEHSSPQELASRYEVKQSSTNTHH